MSLTTQFHKLHARRSPFVLGNIWDAITAKLAEKSGFPALGTSSLAIADSLGYGIGEQVPIKQLFDMIEGICMATSIPVSVDLEGGYSENPNDVAEYVNTLSNLGVAGVNIEDSYFRNGKRYLGEAKVLAEKIAAIKAKSKIFVNARTDTYTTGRPDRLLESINRGELYKSAGADGLFVPLIESPNDIKELISEVHLPLNVIITPNLPQFDELKRLGVKRISLGPNLYHVVMKELSTRLTEIYNQKDWSSLVEDTIF